MKRLISFLVLFLSCLLCCAQVTIEKCDTILKEACYTSYYSRKILGPSFVVYKLYKGGGNVDRKGMTFSSKFPHFSYSKSGYDKGHLCPAEDFAYNMKLERSTFKYYNAVPMSKSLNRGRWERYENQVRKLSQTDSLLIICGGCNYDKLIPKNCFKIVYSLSTGKVIFALLFSNNEGVIEVQECTDLEKYFKFCLSCPSKFLFVDNNIN